jgi:hypothetical protein
MGQTVYPEMLVFNLNQTLGNYPIEGNFNTFNHGESLKFNVDYVVSDVSVQPIDLILKSQVVEVLECLTVEDGTDSVGLLDAWKMGLIRCPETSVTTNLRCVTLQESEDLT